MKQIFRLIAFAAVSIPALLLSYAAWWAVQYRVPSRPGDIIDLRKSSSESPFYITFCASLASNAHGFPGHSYVVWSESPQWNQVNAEAVGFVPRHSKDQLASVFTSVPGLMVRGASEGNMANLDTLTVIVDRDEYEKTRRLREQWDPDVFRTGVRDCVAFMDFIAEDTGLVAPARKFSYPQDHLKQMKALNVPDGNNMTANKRHDSSTQPYQLCASEPIRFDRAGRLRNKLKQASGSDGTRDLDYDD